MILKVPFNPSHSRIINTVLSTNPKQSPIPATIKNINFKSTTGTQYMILGGTSGGRELSLQPHCCTFRCKTKEMLQIILHYAVVLHLLCLFLLPKAKLQTGKNYHRKAILVLLLLINICCSGFFVCLGFFCLVVFFSLACFLLLLGFF